MEKQPFKLNKLFIIIPAVILPLAAIGLYLFGLFNLPATIESAYQGKDCPKVQSSYNFAARFYSGIVESYPEFSAYSDECGLYLEAQSKENDKEWEAAHNAYKDYEQTYPSGIMAGEVHEHQATVMVSWAKQQVEQKLYREAIENAKAVLAGYADTSSAPEAEKLIAGTYVAWAVDKRTAGDFTSAEAMLNELLAWAKDNSKNEYVDLANQELARTLLEWGTDLTGKQEFITAEKYLQRSIEIAPNTDAGKEITAQVHTALSKLHTDWGASRLAKKDFESAVGHFEQAAKFAPTDNQASINEMLTDAYIQWAADLTEKEEFTHALEKIDLALANANSDAGKKAAEAAQQKTYAAFSNSDEQEAQEAMAFAAKQICTGQKPDLPIFGTDPNNILAYTYPQNFIILSDKTRATTPSSMHYVVCIYQTMSSYSKFSQSYSFFNPGYYEIELFQVVWDVTLRDANTGKIIAQQQFTGDKINFGHNGGVFYAMLSQLHQGYNAFSGPAPETGLIENWLQINLASKE